MSIEKMFYRGAHAAVFVYNVDSRISLKEVSFRYEYFNQNCNTSNAIYMLVGNKCDLADERRVTSEDVEDEIVNNEMKFKFIGETSCLQIDTVNNLFTQMIDLLVEQIAAENMQVKQ